ncbi:AAA family ATPase [Flavobacterium sp. B183]|uniref:AAA family ATPase n=1 Tax=Flavobacterium sp. B183 TaxID=907046 RepID=UPI00201EE07B|nr:AAA family ATPase [Flavobacterium sp. B183]URC13969.1 AAA family ATPase [Flavobacterium sp. B183]URC14010.1 AAA family ATPase [Flavobacterium sp. B183]
MAKLTQIQKLQQIPSAIEAYLQENTTTQVALAKLAGIDKAYVNQIVKGNETIGKAKIADRYYEAIALAIGLKLEKTYWQHFNTFNFKQSILTFENAREKKIRLGVDGDTGLGKSYAASMYKRKYPTQVFLVKCSGIENSKEFAINLANEVGVVTTGTKGAIIKRVCEKIKNLGNNPLLIIDEFENSKSGNIPTVKTIADELEGHAAVIVIGIDVQKMLLKGAERRKNGFVQTNRRWSFGWTNLDPSISEDIIAICQELGITNKPAQNWLNARVKDFDSLRNICTTALEEAEKENQEVNISLLNELFPL